MTGRSEQPSASGFHGAIGSLPLVDLLQVWSLNRFSGLVVVRFRERVGHLYFVDGELVHAEAEQETGEQAVGVILGWPEGAFEPFPNTTTMKRTIDKRLSHLLLDAHRVIDERRRTPGPPPAPPPAAEARGPAEPTVLDRIRAIRGVTRLVRFGRDGQPGPGEGPGGEELAARALYLALNHAGAIGATFGLRDLAVASLEGAAGSFLVVHAGPSYLAVAVEPGVAVEPVVAQVRCLLTRPAAR